MDGLSPIRSPRTRMTPAQGIEKLGFRCWYERQLIEGHMYLVTCLLSVLLLGVCLEQFSASSAGGKIAMIALVVAGGYLAMRSLRRYNFLLVRAETLGSQSNCGHCSAYGSIKVLETGAHAPEESGAPAAGGWLRVRCKKCGSEWRMEHAG